LVNADARLDDLLARSAELTRDFNTQAKRLSETRRGAAKTLSAQVSALLAPLGMAGGRFEISVEAAAPARFTPTGIDTIEFLVSANPGQPLRPLNKVASGGELSRISLAIQVITANSGRIPTLIFDEVDTGIGGGVAEVVGRQLRTLGEARQVLCVTHLPQVAAQAISTCKSASCPAKPTPAPASACSIPNSASTNWRACSAAWRSHHKHAHTLKRC